jgi:uncharacterized phage protein (TIGR02218 family)
VKTSDATLRAALYDANVMVGADLVDVDLALGHQRWTAADQNVVVGGVTYYAGGPVIAHGAVRSAAATEVAVCDLTLKGSYQISGRTVASRALSGEFDNRDVAFRRIFKALWTDTPTTAVDVFTGRVAEVLIDSFGVELRVKSIMYKTEEHRPLRIIQTNCPWVLYSPECGAVASSFRASDSVAAGTTASAVKLTTGTSLATPGGTIEFTSGALNGIVAVIRAYDAGSKTATLVTQLPAVPATNDTLYVYRGCDRTRTTCGSVFGRLVSMGGFPDAPRKAA